jgi:hypothetical protein
MDDKVWVVIGQLPYEAGVHLVGVFTTEAAALEAELRAARADEFYIYTVVERTLGWVVLE